jgi:hypothetical protein
MSPLFGMSEAKAAQDDAAKAEADRLGALAPADMAVELMPAFGRSGELRPRSQENIAAGLHLASMLGKFLVDVDEHSLLGLGEW